MKKLLLIAALGIGFAANAQTITVKVNGNEIQNGDVVNFNEWEVREIHQTLPNGVEISGTLYELNPHAEAFTTNNSTYDITVKNTTADPASVPPTVVLNYCWPSGCIGMGYGESVTNSGVLANNNDLGIHPNEWDYFIDSEFTLSCDVDIVEQGNPSNNFSFTLNLIYDPNYDAAVEGILDDANVSAEYFDLMGRKVVSPAKGQLVIERRGAKAVKKIML